MAIGEPSDAAGNRTEDEASIGKLVARYADAVNRRDREAWAATWAPGGVWRLPGRDAVRGADDVVAQWSQAMARIPFVVQLIYHGVVEVDGATARGTWYLCEHMKFDAAEGASVMFNIGCYQDQYAQTDGEWRFLERSYTVLYSERRGDGKDLVDSIATAAVPEPPWQR